DPRFMTVNTRAPDLRVLSILPAGTRLVSSQPREGVPSITFAPPVDAWELDGKTVRWTAHPPPESQYRIADLGTNSVLTVNAPRTLKFGNAPTEITYSKPDGQDTISLSLPARETISNGDFAGGGWGP